MLDFTETILSSRELRLLRDDQEPIKDEIDVIRRHPERSLAIILNVLDNAGVSLASVRDLLYEQNEFGEPTDILRASASPFSADHRLPLVTPQPSSVAPLPIIADSGGVQLIEEAYRRGWPSGISLAQGIEPSAHYDADVTSLRSPYETYLKTRATRQALQMIRSEAEDAPATLPCEFANFICYISNYHDTGIPDLKRNLDQVIPGYKQNETYLSDWDISIFADRPPSAIFLRAATIRPDLSQLTGVYELRTSSGDHRFIVLQRDLGSAPAWLSSALTQDGAMFERFGLDPGLMTDAAASDIAAAAQRVLSASSGAVSTKYLLNQVGMYSTASEGLGVEPPTWLYGTEAGRALATEMTLANAIIASATSGAPQADAVAAVPIKAVADAISVMAKEGSTFVEASTHKIADLPVRSIKQIKAQAADTYVGVQISYSGEAPSIGGVVGSGPMQINVGYGLNNALLSSLSVSGQTLATLNINLNPRDVGLTGDLGPVNLPPLGDELRTSTAISTATGTIYVNPEVSRVPSSSSVSRGTGIGPGVISAAPSGSTELGAYWPQLPLMPPPMFDHMIPLQDGQRVWLGSLLYSAQFQMTDAERLLVWRTLQGGSMTNPVRDLLVDRGRRSVETEKIEGKLWFRTTHTGDLLGRALRGRGPLTKAAAMKAYNTEELARAKKIAHGSDFRDGQAAVLLTYGDNYTTMMYTFTYELPDHKTVTFNEMWETPFWLVRPVRLDPYGHVYEKMMAVTALDFVAKLGERYTLLLEVEGARMVDAQQYRSGLSQVIDATTHEVVEDALKHAVIAYMTSLESWVKKVEKSGSITEPFVPPLDAVPMLNFFPPPLEWQERHDETVAQILLSQRLSRLVRNARTGELSIAPPPPP